MKRCNSKQPTNKKPVLANSELWREIPIGGQGKVRGGLDGCSGDDSLNGCSGDDTGEGSHIRFPFNRALAQWFSLGFPVC